MTAANFSAGPSQRQGSKNTHPVLLALLIILLTAATTSVLWFKYVRVLTEMDKNIVYQAAGFSKPFTHKLDPKFTDANGDLVASVPTDPSKFVDPPTLRFAFIEEDDPAKQKVAWQPFMDYLSKVTGKPVEYKMLVGANDMFKSMRDGELDVAGFNTGSVPTAVNLCGFVPVCAIPTSEGSALTHTVIIVPAESPLKSPNDLRGHELTLTEINSNSGYKAPLVLLHSDFGLQPLTDIMLRYSGSHVASIEGIASHRYGAAAVADDMLAREVAAGKIKPDQYRVIYTSESFPTAGLGYVYNLKPELAAKVKEALLTFDWKGTPLEEILGGAKQTKFLPVNYKTDWALIRRIDDEMGAEEKIQ
jgi:phosphonate transport system substrate-binding protein